LSIPSTVAFTKPRTPVFSLIGPVAAAAEAEAVLRAARDIFFFLFVCVDNEMVNVEICGQKSLALHRGEDITNQLNTTASDDAHAYG
jgi:hypothetical protein